MRRARAGTVRALELSYFKVCNRLRKPRNGCGAVVSASLRLFCRGGEVELEGDEYV